MNITRRSLLVGASAATLTAATVAAQQETASASTASPVFLGSVCPALTHVTQDLAVDTAGHRYVTQAASNASGTEDVVVSRLDRHGRTLDSMRLLGAGHGIGLDVQLRSGRPWLSLNWTDASAGSLGRARDHVTLAYRPSSWTRSDAVARLGLTVTPLLVSETLVQIDQARRLAACAQWAATPGRQVYTLRHLDDLAAGRDRPLGRVSVPIADGTFQGFATIGSTLYRLTGTGADSGRMSSSDPIRVHAYSWHTGHRIARHTYPTIGQHAGHWRDGHAEPEGMSAYRTADGTTALMVGIVTGNSGHHRWDLYRIPTDTKDT